METNPSGGAVLYMIIKIPLSWFGFPLGKNQSNLNHYKV